MVEYLRYIFLGLLGIEFWGITRENELNTGKRSELSPLVVLLKDDKRTYHERACAMAHMRIGAHQEL